MEKHIAELERLHIGVSKQLAASVNQNLQTNMALCYKKTNIDMDNE